MNKDLWVFSTSVNMMLYFFFSFSLFWSDSVSDNLRRVLRTIYRVIKGKYYCSVTNFARNYDILQAASWTGILFFTLNCISIAFNIRSEERGLSYSGCWWHMIAFHLFVFLWFAKRWKILSNVHSCSFGWEFWCSNMKNSDIHLWFHLLIC